MNKKKPTKESSVTSVLQELLALSPIPEQFNLTKRLSPTMWHEKREALLTELIDEEGPGDDLIDHLKKCPDDYHPEFLESYRKSRNAWDEIIAQRTKEQVEADMLRLQQRLFDESRLDVHYDNPENRRHVIKNLKEALGEAKRILEKFDADPVRLHATTRHLKYRYHSYRSADECVACAASAQRASAIGIREDAGDF